ncbi:hypothetical protein RI129_010960 [Pyrocoelia pectoralis]|uniref:Uncharacterized protein n=1 Tax=Pyrocoelia pectoralis TaxID=417401 RepID=A0AAN7V5C2_9COLE
MSRYELEFACLIPKSNPEELLKEPFFTYKGTDYKKTVRFRIPACKPVISRLKRFWNWICFAWSHSRSRKCRRICYIFMVLVVLTLFTVICVFLPLLFKYSSSFCRHIIFSPTVATHDSFNEVIEVYKDYNSKTFYKPKNFYVKINHEDDAQLGVWHLPQHVIGKNLNNNYMLRQYSDTYANISTNNYLLFFHDGYGNRRNYIADYSKLLHLFNIITFDYRAYGDSYEDVLKEEGLVRDSVKLFKWLRSHVNGSIFLWGDNLGSAIAAHTVVQLKKEHLYPCGILLENPFTSMGEQLGYSWFIARMNWYMPWYKSIISDPLEENDLTFNTNKYINEIDCPIRFLEWNYHRANHFNIKISYDDYYSNGNRNEKNGLRLYRYYKTDKIWNEDKNFLRSFVKAGRNYCDTKKV